MLKLKNVGYNERLRLDMPKQYKELMLKGQSMPMTVSRNLGVMRVAIALAVVCGVTGASSSVLAQSRYLPPKTYNGSNVAVNMGVLGDPYMLEAHAPELVALQHSPSRAVSTTQFHGVMPLAPVQMANAPISLRPPVVQEKPLTPPISLTAPQTQQTANKIASQDAPAQVTPRINPQATKLVPKPIAKLEPATSAPSAATKTADPVAKHLAMPMRDPRLPVLKPTPISKLGQQGDVQRVRFLDSKGNLSEDQLTILQAAAQNLVASNGKATLMSFSDHPDPSTARRISLVYAVEARRTLMDLGVSAAQLSVRARGKSAAANGNLVEIHYK